jgi:hypothetical protein
MLLYIVWTSTRWQSELGHTLHNQHIYIFVQLYNIMRTLCNTYIVYLIASVSDKSARHM